MEGNTWTVDGCNCSCPVAHCSRRIEASWCHESGMGLPGAVVETRVLACVRQVVKTLCGRDRRERKHKDEREGEVKGAGKEEQRVGSESLEAG